MTLKEKREENLMKNKQKEKEEQERQAQQFFEIIKTTIDESLDEIKLAYVDCHRNIKLKYKYKNDEERLDFEMLLSSYSRSNEEIKSIFISKIIDYIKGEEEMDFNVFGTHVTEYLYTKGLFFKKPVYDEYYSIEVYFIDKKKRRTR